MYGRKCLKIPTSRLENKREHPLALWAAEPMTRSNNNNKIKKKASVK
jgi:hypothetical protein